MPKIQVSRNRELNEIFLKCVDSSSAVEYSLNENSIQFLMLEVIGESDIAKVNTAIEALILEGKVQQIYSTMQSGQAESGMITLNQSLAHLYKRRIITMEDALKHSTNQEELIELINRNQISRRR